jgi:transcriptional repressor NrdR
MKCPFCSFDDDKVIDSRLSKDGNVIRRRRECLECLRRYTTYERIEEASPLVIKKDGRREAFTRQKIINGIKTACQKRPISVDMIEKIVNKVEYETQECGKKEISSSVIGEQVMEELKALDKVAYVRFASVYCEFKNVTEFMDELHKLNKSE